MILRRLRVLACVIPIALASAAVAPEEIDAARALFGQRGKSMAAQQAFEAIVARDPRNAPALLHLGLLSLRRDDTEKAITYLEQAAQLTPDDGEVHKGLGDAYGRSAQKASIFQQLGFAKKCLASYQRAVALAPNRADFRQCLFEYYRQAPGFVGGGFDKAAAEAAAIKQLAPHAGRVAFATLYLGEKKYAEAFAQFDEVLARDPDDFMALYEIGRLSALTGQQLERGLAALRRCLELPAPAAADAPTRVVILWRLGTVLEKQRETTQARAAYTAALEADPKFAPAAEALRALN